MNTPRTLPGYFAALLAASAVSLVSSHARAACTTNAECDHGFECKVVASSTCAGVACPDNGEPCPPPPPCDPVEIRDCVPGSCAVDADCAAGMVCFESTTSMCTGTATPACPPDVKCDVPPPEPPTCTTTTEHLCVPRYLLPCNEAADCGTGFNCVPDPDSCWCSGSSGGGTPGTEPLPGVPAPMPTPVPTGSSGGTDPAPAPTMTTPLPAPTGTAPEPMCGCTPSTTKHCAPQVTDCTDTSQCPSGWLCKEIGASGGSACGGRVLPDGGVETTCEPAPPPTVILQCVPPYADYIPRYYDGSTSNSGGSGTLSGALPPQGQIGGAPTGAPSPIPAPGGETTGTPKSGGSTPSASSGDTGGCQVGHGNAGTGASLLALFGLVGLARRRARR